MKILVSDTSVLIDLERGGLLEAAFGCGHPLVVPDYPYQVQVGAGKRSVASAVRAQRCRIDSGRSGVCPSDHAFRAGSVACGLFRLELRETATALAGDR